MNKFMPELADENDRILALQETAHNITEGNYDAPLTDEEIEHRKSIFFVNCNEIDDLDKQKKDLTKDLTDQIKAIKERNSVLKREIREGACKAEGLQYEVAEDDYMCTYDRFGCLLSKRRLTPEDRRSIASKIPFGGSKLFIPSGKTGTNS